VRACSILAVLLLWVQHTSAAEPRRALVLSSIRPLDLIVASLAGPEVDHLPLRATADSAHDFSLRPSDMRRLQAADLFIWVGPVLERPLEALLGRMPEVPALSLLPRMSVPAEEDPHVWLDPILAIEVAGLISQELEHRALVSREVLQQRRMAFDAQMRERELATARELADLRQVPFVVMHDGYHHFVQRFGLRQVAAVTATHEHQPGARALAGLRRTARAEGAVCLLRDRADNAALARGIAQDLALRVAEVDILARAEDGPGTDFDRFLKDFATSVADCLRGTAPTAEKPT